MRANAYEQVDELTREVRVAIVKNADTLFPMLAQTPEGRERLRKERTQAWRLINHPFKPTADWALLMLWWTGRALAKHKKRRIRVPKGMVLIDRNELARLCAAAGRVRE